MISRKDNARLNIREVLLEKMSHVRVEAFAIRHRCLGCGEAVCSRLLAAAFHPKAAQGDAVPGYPGNT